eukprot:CAMPEP_0204519314 /NCGR_PEP_ID=MMETSP0661-20131031/4669_1 /ASSEMBLY_ACC=CAM_ASM_000606 /TAXON_ID=109239 /ORGANISM="Alexandrium margalefi, Strain AMGDE01CS-322" /LENGTH=63 /DNA_ID=CAMNT_0051524811 /DNA_START=191 /DNA_END=379 /DNA_ORIENTATION=-
MQEATSDGTKGDAVLDGQEFSCGARHGQGAAPGLPYLYDATTRRTQCSSPRCVALRAEESEAR